MGYLTDLLIGFVIKCSERPPPKRKGFESAFIEYDKDMDKYYYGPGEDGEIDEECWRNHMKQIYESGGFDVEDFPDHCIISTYSRTNAIGPDSRVYQLAAIALEQFNSKHWKKYKLVRVIKANAQLVSGSIHYITFEAVRADDDSYIETFQARVWDRITPREPEVQLCTTIPGWLWWFLSKYI